jgi:predicted Zn-dependent protease
MAKNLTHFILWFSFMMVRRFPVYLVAFLLVFSLTLSQAIAQDNRSSVPTKYPEMLTTSSADNVDLEASLPSLGVHPLPESLQNWHYNAEQGDYLPEIDTNLLGYLIWTHFPLKVYFDKPNTDIDTASFNYRRWQKWQEGVQTAIADWNVYLPLTEVERVENADIIIHRQHPPLNAKINPETGLLELPRARSAQTRYKFYLSKDEPPLLLHQMTIDVSPNQTDDYTLAAIRHEIGHALGIWGHSEVETDIMYFSQVRNSPPISPRDINTLQKIYQQPTRLGWELPHQAKLTTSFSRLRTKFLSK